jgi:hypothetical protein
MEKTKPPETGQPVKSAEETKPRTCLECGLLTTTGNREFDQDDRTLLHCLTRTESGGYSSAELPSDIEWTRCFKNVWKYNPERSINYLIEQKERPRDDCSGFASFEVGYTPAELIKRIEERTLWEKMLARLGEKPTKRRPSRGTSPTDDEKVIIAAINEGVRGPTFCHRLDERKVKPRPRWESKGQTFPWPGSYVSAYTKGHPKVRARWRKKIQDYKHYVQTKFPDLIHRKAPQKHSTTREGE